MRLELTGRHVDITPTVRKIVEKRLAKVTRLLKDRAVSAQVVISKEKAGVHAEVTLHARGERFFHGAATGRNVDVAVGAATEKVDHQAQKQKSRRVEGRRKGVAAAKAGLVAPVEPEPKTVRVVRARRYDVKPMSVDDAALEVGAGQDAFVVFRNSSTDTINVLFRRPDGNLGLIEAEA